MAENNGAVVIVSAARTPVGSFNGALSSPSQPPISGRRR
jgi:acetyl-CoA acetyltransferase